MSNTAEISTAVVVGKNGSILPKNFDSLSEKKQKGIILSELAEAQSEICNIVDDEERAKQEIKSLQTLLKSSKEFKRLNELKKSNKTSRVRVNQLLSERNGILKVAKKMGLDIKEELKKIKAIES